LQVRPTIVSHFKFVSATRRCIHLCEIAGFARHAHTPSFVVAKTHEVHDLLFCASWPVEQSPAGKRSTFRTPSLLNQRVKEVFEAAFNCLSGEPSDKLARPRFVPVYASFSCFVVLANPFVVLQWCI
jgi:hypothetical protein